MIKQHSVWIPALITLLLLLNSCKPSIAIPSPTITLKPSLELPVRTIAPTKESTIAPSSTVTQTSSPQRKTTQAPTATIPPGPDVDIFYLSNGMVNRFNIRAWSSERLELSDSEILEATTSPDKQFIAFTDINGLHLSKSPFTEPASVIHTVGDAGALLISNDNHLAYSDQEGLKIYDIQSGAITLLKSHFRQPFDIVRISFYIPSIWSPDSKWLWIKIQHYESAPLTLFNIVTGIEYDFSTCTSGIDWSPDSRTFVTTIFYSGYYGCGEDNGVFVANIKGNKLVGEKVYSEGRDVGVSSDASWDPIGNRIVFVQRTYPKHPSLYRLLLWNYSTKQIQELDIGSYELTSPKWSVDGDKLYYVVHAAEDSWIISLDLKTYDKNITPKFPKNAEIITVLSGHDWLLLRIDNNFPEMDNLLLINARDGRQTILSDIVVHDWIEWR